MAWHTTKTVEFVDRNGPATEYALALILPLMWPGFLDDEDIFATVEHVARTEPLPWSRRPYYG